MQNKPLIFAGVNIIPSAPPLIDEQGLGGLGGEHNPKPLDVPQSLKFADPVRGNCSSIAQQQSSIGQSSHEDTVLLSNC